MRPARIVPWPMRRSRRLHCRAPTNRVAANENLGKVVVDARKLAMEAPMSSSLRKFVLTVHIATSVGLLGAVAGFLALAVTGLASGDSQIGRAAYPAMDVLAWYIIVPLMFASLAIGIVSSLGTNWGLFRYNWVATKLVITVVATVVLLLQMKMIGRLAAAALAMSLVSPEHLHERMGLVLHSGGGLLVLLVPLALSVYKPWGKTRYGQRKLDELRPV